MPVRLTINGKPHTLDVAPDTPILWVLRDEVGLTGTKFGCGLGQCGACTVLLAGRAVRSCLTPVSAVGTMEVTTIEGLTGTLSDRLRAAWEEIDVPQCGYCQSGQVMSAAALLREHSQPTKAQIDVAMRGNICRCGTYARIERAIRRAAGER